MRLAAAALAALVLGVAAAPASANHSWGGYHWARTANPFTISLGDNVNSSWDAYLAGASADWSNSTVLDAPVVAGLAGGKRCKPTSGRAEVCNGSYGRNGWLGIASIWASGSHITQATVKVNDTYYNTAFYNTPIWRAMVVCQEVGHVFGLDHQDESGADFHTCMDYASNPDADNTHPNQHDYDMLKSIYSHTDSFTTIGSASATGSGRGLRRVEDDLWVEDLGNGRKRFVHVYWVDRARHHNEPPHEGQ